MIAGDNLYILTLINSYKFNS
ncbi:hypothetical protein PSAC2689_100111 [Paraburkholderia sacchari]